MTKYIIFLNQNSMNKREGFLKRQGPSISDNYLGFFLDNYLNCHLLYHNYQSSNQKIFEQPQIIKHVFTNYTQLQKVAIPLSICSQAQNSHAFLQEFNNSSVIKSNQNDQYSNYLKEYETVIKRSRRKQYVSPEKQNKQLNLLINQFLSDLNDHSKINQNTQKLDITSNKTIKQAFKNQKNRIASEVKVEKIDLTTFQSNKSNMKQAPTNNKSKSKTQKNTSRQVQESQIVTKFIDISQPKIMRQNGYEKSKDRTKIQVKVKEVKPILDKKMYINPNIEPMTINNNANLQDHKQANDLSYKKQQHNSGNYSKEYLKKKQQKQSIIKQINVYSEQSSNPSIQEKQSKKPIKIQIQIPEDELALQIQSSEKQVLQDSELDLEKNQIIKDIYSQVMKLLHKTKQETNNEK